MKSRNIALLLMFACLGPWMPVRADVVTEWNAITVACVFGPPYPGNRAATSGMLDVALVQAAVHDAVQAIQGRFESYAYTSPSMLGVGSPEAAAAAASYHVLAGLYGADAPCLASAPDPAVTYADDEGLRAGEEAAEVLLFQYRPTHVLPTDPFLGSDEPGQWRPTPGVTQGMSTFLAHALPFAMNRPRQFRPLPPPKLGGERYRQDYREVMALGPSTNSTRTAEQTELARFWLIIPTTLWQRTLRGIADEHLSDVGDTARLFALAGFAAADSLIATFEAGYYYTHWRPVTAIREGDLDGNPGTVGDSAWTPFVSSPPEPEYPAGHSTVAGAVTKILALYFGTDEFQYSILSDGAGVTVNPRHYVRFSQAADEAVEARVLQGLHFRFSCKRGLLQGRRIAGWTFDHYLRPLPEN